jgi:hypothetical protein
VTYARKFMSAARAAARSKPVVVIKAGRSSEAAKAAQSHGGALARSDRIYDAAFSRAGMLRVETLDQLFAAVETLGSGVRVAGDRLAIVSNGGGSGVLATDSLIQQGGRIAELTPATVERLNAVLPATWSRANPIDIIGDAAGERYAATLEAVLTDPGNDAVLVLTCPTAVAESSDAARATLGATAARKRPVFTSWLGESAAIEARHLFAQHRIPTYETPSEAVQAFMHLVRYRRNQEMLRQVPPSFGSPSRSKGAPIASRSDLIPRSSSARSRFRSQRRRLAATSGRSCSAALKAFFWCRSPIRRSVLCRREPGGGEAQTALEFRLELDQRDIRCHRDQPSELGFMGREQRTAMAAHARRRGTSGRAHPLHQLDRGPRADRKASRCLADRAAALDRAHDPQPQVHRNRCWHDDIPAGLNRYCRVTGAHSIQ